MTGDVEPTTFITGAAGFIGTELVTVLTDRGHRVFGLAESGEAAARLRRAGAVPVSGNLLEPGQWQDEAATDWIFHLPPRRLRGPRMPRRRTAAIARARVQMDAHLLDSVGERPARRIAYVLHASCYGATGPHRMTEDESRQPPVWARCCTPALDRLDGYIVAGLPIVTAIVGCVYGNGSWFRTHVVEPILAGRPVLQAGTTGRWVSPIHVHDLRPRAGASRGARPARRPLLSGEHRSDHDARVRGNIRARRAASPPRLARAAVRDAVRGRRDPRRPAAQRAVQHPAARHRLPLSVSDPRTGTRAGAGRAA